MDAPVISASSSILGYKRNESFEFQPAATNNPVIWEASGLPTGVAVDVHYSKDATIAAATDLVSATAHGYSDGDRVYFPSLTGGAGLTTTAIYYVRDKTADTFKVSAQLGGAAVNITTDYTAAQVRKVSSGKISGSAATAGVHAFTLTATNTAGEAGSREFVLGIASEVAGSASSGEASSDWEIDVVSRLVSAASASSSGSTAETTLATWKEGDVALLSLRFTKGGEAVDPDPATIKLAVKEYEPDGLLYETDDFEKITEPDGSVYFNLVVPVTGDALAAALSNNEGDKSTGFDAICEIEWTFEVTHNSAPLTLRYTTKTFLVRHERDMVAE